MIELLPLLAVVGLFVGLIRHAWRNQIPIRFIALPREDRPSLVVYTMNLPDAPTIHLEQL